VSDPKKRHKDGAWAIPTDTDGRISGWTYVPIALLMDIRDELKSLNALLHCPNFQAIPRKLDRISKNTAKPRKKR
jgi:hypothetical protein